MVLLAKKEVGQSIPLCQVTTSSSAQGTVPVLGQGTAEMRHHSVARNQCAQSVLSVCAARALDELCA